MDHLVLIPLFPLRILPLPGELVPLHIFEPRYKQLLNDVESRDIRFGIYFDHPLNEKHIGSVMRLESIIKRYPKGELDIIVKCEDLFYLGNQYQHFPNKLYPGGDVSKWDVNLETYPDQSLHELFQEFQLKRGISQQNKFFTMYQIANELNLDFPDRYKFMLLTQERMVAFLTKKIAYQIQLMEHEQNSRDIFHLN